MNENQKNRLALIISGLAASGDYTHLKQVDTGKTRFGEKIFEDAVFLKSSLWDEESKVRRYDILEDAITIFQELEKTEL
jgi:phage major head subunit gpT-like protein